MLKSLFIEIFLFTIVLYVCTTPHTALAFLPSGIVATDSLSILKKTKLPLSGGKGFGSSPKPKFEYAGSVRPGKQSKKREVPPHINRPDYADDGKPKGKQPKFPWMIEIKSEEQIAKMRVSGRIAREVLDLAGRAAQPGVTTDEIDRIVHEACLERNAYPSPLNYEKFPKSCCTSLNEVICHGIPDSTVLKAGDIINIDITVYHDGYHGDCSEMFLVGGEEAADPASLELIQVTYDAWQEAVKFCMPGKNYKEIGAIIEDYVTARGYSSVPGFCGHGIGSIFHTTPHVFHVRNNQPLGVMEVGHVFTIEPMICAGGPQHLLWPDDWTATTKDGQRSAQFEHTFLMTEAGLEALTKKLPDSPVQPWEKK